MNNIINNFIGGTRETVTPLIFTWLWRWQTCKRDLLLTLTSLPLQLQYLYLKSHKTIVLVLYVPILLLCLCSSPLVCFLIYIICPWYLQRYCGYAWSWLVMLSRFSLFPLFPSRNAQLTCKTWLLLALLVPYSWRILIYLDIAILCTSIECAKLQTTEIRSHDCTFCSPLRFWTVQCLLSIQVFLYQTPVLSQASFYVSCSL